MRSGLLRMWEGELDPGFDQFESGLWKVDGAQDTALESS